MSLYRSYVYIFDALSALDSILYVAKCSINKMAKFSENQHRMVEQREKVRLWSIKYAYAENSISWSFCGGNRLKANNLIA